MGNTDRVNSNSSPRRRTTSGWETDYSRRRGESRTTVAAAAAVGFGGGIVLGAMINSNDHEYYYHGDSWTDVYGGYHEVGYYSPEGYHYSSPQEFGYCPPFGDPGYIEGCEPDLETGSTWSTIGWAAFICVFAFGGCCFPGGAGGGTRALKTSSNNNKDDEGDKCEEGDEDDEGDDEELLAEGRQPARVRGGQDPQQR